MIPPAAELSVLTGVCDWATSIYLRVMCRGTYVCPLWKSIPAYALAEEATTCISIMHSVWIGQFSGDGRFGDCVW